MLLVQALRHHTPFPEGCLPPALSLRLCAAVNDAAHGSLAQAVAGSAADPAGDSVDDDAFDVAAMCAAAELAAAAWSASPPAVAAASAYPPARITARFALQTRFHCLLYHLTLLINIAHEHCSSTLLMNKRDTSLFPLSSLH